ncbi:MAG: ADP-ribosylglycohydrolase family protein [Phycisphaerales bacterium]
MHKFTASVIWLVLCFTLGTTCVFADDQPTYRRLPVKEFREKMKAGWIGQMVGVSWGGPTEFKFNKSIIPAKDMPQWQPALINKAFPQDDLYVEMTFLRTLELYGLDCSIRQAGIDFANTRYPLWAANANGRTNLRAGIAPPDSSHPKFNGSPNAIDYQIEADYSGMIAPGMPNTVIALGEKFGRLMNYGDGLYAGQFIGAMYAEAFFEKDVEEIVRAGLRAIPADSQYGSMVRDILQWYKDVPDWEKAWQICEDKYWNKSQYMKQSSGNVDSRINGAYLVLGLLYGKGDLDQTIIIATRCGKDSDCNPSSAAGILFTTLGSANIPECFTRELNEKTLFQHTAYNFPTLLEVCEKLARQAVLAEGGKIEKDAGGEEVFLIPVKAATPSPLVAGWVPDPIAGSKFTAAEMAQITAAIPPESIRKALETFAPGWSITYCGTDRNIGLHAEERGYKNVLVTYPHDNNTPCVLSRKVDIPSGKKTAIKLTVGPVKHDGPGEWSLIVRADGKEIFQTFIGKDIDRDLAIKITTPERAAALRKKLAGQSISSAGWTNLSIDLSPYAGRTIFLELCNAPTSGYYYELAYWADISIESQ